MQKDVLLTPEGLESLKKEIEYLSNDKRREVAARIKEAREFGDISENSEYDDAKNEQAMLEARIASLEDKLRSASVIDPSRALLGRRARRLTGLRQGRGLRQVAAVHDRRLDRGGPVARTGSPTSRPVGKALLGRKRNDAVKVQLPNGKARELKITKIDVA